MCHRQDRAGNIPKELIVQAHLKYNHPERNCALPWNSKEGVDNDADGNNKEVEMIAASLLQQVLLPIHYHRCDLLVLQVKLSSNVKVTFLVTMSQAYYEYEDI